MNQAYQSVNPLGISESIIQWTIPIINFELNLRWYGFMYLVSFVCGFFIVRYLVQSGFSPFLAFFQKKFPAEKSDALLRAAVDSFVTTMALSMVLGARVFYCLIYDTQGLIDNPLSLLYLWKGGLSFHGAAIGMALGCWHVARRHQIPFFSVSDTLVLGAGPGLFLGRLGNFINGELYGRVTDVSWAMIFPLGGEQPRHPSMLYEGLAEGVFLSTILWMLKSRGYLPRYGQISAIFLVGYGFFRFMIEFVREPDVQMGYYFSFFTMGQILCFLMICCGFYFWSLTIKQPQSIPYIATALKGAKKTKPATKPATRD